MEDFMKIVLLKSQKIISVMRKCEKRTKGEIIIILLLLIIEMKIFTFTSCSQQVEVFLINIFKLLKF